VGSVWSIPKRRHNRARYRAARASLGKRCTTCVAAPAIDLDLVIQCRGGSHRFRSLHTMRDITPNFARVAGLTWVRWRARTCSRRGGVKGLHASGRTARGPPATTAFQATNRARENQCRQSRDEKDRTRSTPAIYKDDSPAVKERWPHLYRNIATAGALPDIAAECALQRQTFLSARR
jgi:hypothetical protein